MDRTELRPSDACPKCGFIYGFLHSRPTYIAGRDGTDAMGHEWWEPEKLCWTCGVCGYQVTTDTADAK